MCPKRLMVNRGVCIWKQAALALSADVLLVARSLDSGQKSILKMRRQQGDAASSDRGSDQWTAVRLWRCRRPCSHAMSFHKTDATHHGNDDLTMYGCPLTHAFHPPGALLGCVAVLLLHSPLQLTRQSTECVLLALYTHNAVPHYNLPPPLLMLHALVLTQYKILHTAQLHVHVTVVVQ